MTWQVTLRDAAGTDLQEAREWYEKKRVGLGDEFLVAMADCLTRIEENPLQFPVYYRDFRRAITDRFPYKLFFRMEGDFVIVYRVLHGAQDHVKEVW